jgi:hypothetical protein
MADELNGLQTKVKTISPEVPTFHSLLEFNFEKYVQYNQGLWNFFANIVNFLPYFFKINKKKQYFERHV